MHHRRLGTAVGAVLATDALFHGYWTTGATWPAPDARTLSYAVLGAVDVPFTPRVLLPLIGALLLAAGCVVARSRDRGGWVTRWGTLLVATGLLVRGALGVAWCFGLGVEPPFFWINLVLYTPLCLVAGCATFAVARVPRWAAVVPAVPLLLVAALLSGAYGWAPPEHREYTAPDGASYVDTPLARFHYEREGSGPPVVLLSPGAAWTYAWRPQVAALRAAHTVYVVDLPGQGFTTAHDRGLTWDLDGMTRAVGSFLDAMALDRVALAGNSWSGGWALRYAQLHPDRVGSLVLLAPSGLAEKDPRSWELMKYPVLGELLADAGAASRDSTARGVRALFAHPELATDEVVDAMWAPNTFADNRAAMYRLERGLDWRVTEAALPGTATPTLVVWGDRDTVLPVARAARFGALLPHAEVRVLDTCGHALTLDCADRVSALMADFLRDH
ncbi:alpha/beta fold hydrolase [Longispora sp. K20-0274]|uniref:alpha/beta fold hydrolase n=1 Tax=Longispora sp. K20-0274 TaxID=3088255 RepID=UPI00399AEB99